MKILVILITLTLSLFLYGNENKLKTLKTDKCDQTIKTKEYTICYDYNKKGAIWAECNVDGNLTSYFNIVPRPSFIPDENLPKEYQTKTTDYTNNILQMDRGHLCDDASFDYSQESLNLVYKMSNIVPQHKRLNRGTWKALEAYSRQKAEELGKIVVLNVLIYENNNTNTNSINSISVPSKFIKIIENKMYNYEECFEFKNEPPISQDIFYYKISCE